MIEVGLMELIVTVCTLVGCAASIVFALYRMLKGIRTEFREDREALRAEIRENREALRAEIRENSEALRAEIRESSEALRAEFREGIKVVRAGIDVLSAKVGENSERLAAIEGRLGLRQFIVETS